MFRVIALCLMFSCVGGCAEDTSTTPETDPVWVDLSKRDTPDAITTAPWEDVIIIVDDLEDAPRLFTAIGNFETISKSDVAWRLKAPGSDSGFLHFLLNPDNKGPARPADSKAWDKGCYFSIMMRAKNIETIIKDAAPLEWTPLTDVAFLEFGPSKLHIVVLTHTSGLRVQLYERLTTPLPDGFTEFERLSRPFNIMQMVDDRDTSYDFFQQGLGFETFFYGPPYVSDIEEVMPLGIPKALTTTTPYKTGIVMPFKGAEWGRVEMIDIEGMPGKDYSQTCTKDYTGIHAISFPIEDMATTRNLLADRDIDIVLDNQTSIWIKTPDGSNIEFFQK